MHCNSGYYYVTKDLTIWGLCGFRVGILQFCPVCSLWTSRAVGSAYTMLYIFVWPKRWGATRDKGFAHVPIVEFKALD